MSPEEFEELYHQFWGLVYSRFLAALGDVEEALDAAQEVFLRKWCSIDRYDPNKASFKTWLMRNTDHLCIDLIRKRSTGSEVVSIDEIDEVSEEIEVESEARSADMLDIEIALSNLDPLDRHLLIMRFVEEYTWSEIAEITKLTVAQVRRRVDNALKHLRRWFGIAGDTTEG